MLMAVILELYSLSTLNLCRPTVIIIEILDLDLNEPSYLVNEIVSYLLKGNYVLKYYATMNAYFVDASNQ